MPEQLTTPTLEEDIRTLEEYVHTMRNGDKARSALCYLVVIVLGAIAFADLLVNVSTNGCLLLILGFIAICAVERAIGNSLRTALPQASIERVARSEQPEAIPALFRLYELRLPAMHPAVVTALVQSLRNTRTLEGFVGTISLQEKLIALLGQDDDLTETIIATLVRLKIYQSLPKLIRMSDVSAPTAKDQQLRAVVREAVVLLTQDADFGTKADIPAMLDELRKLEFSTLNTSERGYWLKHALAQLLPTLTNNDADLFERRHRHELYSIVRYDLYIHNDWQLIQATILGLGGLEDTDAIPSMSDVAHREAPTEEEQYTRTLAKKQLAILTKIKEKQQVGSMLLRASDAPVTSPEMLLRPAHANVETQPETLLRPHLGE